MVFRFLIAFILSSLIYDLNAQVIYKVDHEGSWQIYLKSYGNTNHFNNKIINQLALANRKVPDKTSFTFLYNTNVSISYNLENQLDATISLQPSICTGDVFVYGFDLSKVLVPAVCNVSLRMIDPVEGERWSVIQQRAELCELAQGVVLGTFPDSLWTEGSRIELKVDQFEFSAEAYATAEKELYLIRDYVAASALADTLEARLKSARMLVHSPESAIQTLVFGAKCLLLLQEASAINSIIIPGKDPMRLNEKLRASTYRYSDLLPYLQSNIIKSSLTGALYRKTGEAYARVLRDALRLSQKTDYYSSPFFYRLYTNCITSGQLLSIQKQLDQFLGNRLTHRWNKKHLSKSTENSILMLANQLMAEERFAESVDILSSAIKMAKANPCIIVSDTISKRLAIARKGLTSSYIKVVQKSINKQLAGLAENYLDEADLYSDKYQMTDFRSDYLPPLYGQLADLYIQKGQSQLNSAEYARALSEFDQAKRISDNHPGVQVSAAYRKGVNEAVRMLCNKEIEVITRFIALGQFEMAEAKLDETLAFVSAYPIFKPDLTLTDSLRRSIANLRYSSLLIAASEFQKSRQPEAALTKLLAATELIRAHHLPQTEIHDTLISRIALPHINELYSKGRVKLWAGEPEQALQLAQQAHQLALSLEVGNIAALLQQYRDVHQQAEALACSRVRGELTSLIGQVESLLVNNHFDDAAQKIVEARELIFSKSYCGLSTAELNQRIAPFTNRIRWNTLHAAGLELIGSGDLNEGIDKLQQAEVLFHTFRLDTVGLINTGLLALSQDSDNRELIDYTIGHLIARHKFDDALMLIEKLHLNKVPASETFDFQQSLARGLALRDKSELGEVPLKTMIKFYTSGDKWYKTFIDGYTFYIKSSL